MLISTNITSIRLIKRTKDTDKAKDKALGQTKEIMKKTAKKNTKKVIKEIRHFNKRSVMFVIS
jgi:hypothetical protein